MRPSPGPASHFKTISCVLFFLHLHQLLQVSFSFASNFHLSFSKQVSMNLYDAVSDVVESLGISIPLHHRLKDNHQLQIALLASSVSIELVSSSARVTSAKFHKAVVQTSGPIDRTPETPGSGKKQKQNMIQFQMTWSFNIFSL